MLNQNEKLERFAAQINRTAEKSVQKIQRQIDKISKTELDSFREAARKEREEKEAYSKARLEQDANHAVAVYASARKKEAAEHREAIVNRVYDKAREQILAFTQTAAYEPLLKQCIEALAATFEASDACVYVRAQDLPLAERICKNLPQVCSVNASDEIQLGLAFAENRAGTVHLEDTFESRLRNDRPRFISTCGLSILL